MSITQVDAEVGRPAPRRGASDNTHLGAALQGSHAELDEPMPNGLSDLLDIGHATGVATEVESSPM